MDKNRLVALKTSFDGVAKAVVEANVEESFHFCEVTKMVA